MKKFKPVDCEAWIVDGDHFSYFAVLNLADGPPKRFTLFVYNYPAPTVIGRELDKESCLNLIQEYEDILAKYKVEQSSKDDQILFVQEVRRIIKS